MEAIFNTMFGPVRYPATGGVVIGDRIVPEYMIADFPGGPSGDDAAYKITIEIVAGVPRCTEITIKRSICAATGEPGREVRPRDLTAFELDGIVESIVAVCSTRITGHGNGIVKSTTSRTYDDIVEAQRVVRTARKGSRRPMTPDKKKQVADIYNAHTTGGLEAVEMAFGVSRATAARYIKAARDSGLIESGKK